MSKKNSNSSSVFIAILSIMLVVAVVGFIFKFTNGLNEDLKTFYIEHNGKQIVATDSQMTFDTESEHRFDCKYISNPDNNTFNLKVVPNVTEETDFSYTVDGKSHKWSEVGDLTSCFNLDKQSNYFIVSFPADFSMQGVLNSLYPESQVVISDTLSLYQYYYTLHVSNYNEKINYFIDFNVSDIVDYVTLINEQIETIAQLDDKIDNLENQIAELETSSDNKDTQISDLQKQIITLNKDKTALEESLNYYKDYISILEDAENSVITLEVDGSVYALFAMPKGSTMFDISIPESVDYEFNCWTVNGEQVDLQGYVINENTTFVADLTYFKIVNFYVGDELFDSQKVLLGNSILIPESPLKYGFEFLGWSLDGVNVVPVKTDNIVDNLNYYAVFEEISVSVVFFEHGSLSASEGFLIFNPAKFNLTYFNPVVEIEFTCFGGFTISDYFFESLDPEVEFEAGLEIDIGDGVITVTMLDGYFERSTSVEVYFLLEG